MHEICAPILIVDDYAHNRAVYGDWLRDIRGVEVVEAATAQRALALAREQDFAMFLLDVNMPDMDGFELASMLRQEPRAEATPIVFVTSEATDRMYLTHSYRMGAVDFMVSAPIHGEILAQKARVFVRMFHKRCELAALAGRAQRENQDLQEQLRNFIREHEQLRAQATHDALTKLPNRALFRDRLCAALARAARNRQRFAVAYIDLDGFKAVNDSHGHGTGDALIVSIAARLLGALRATDTIARLGGDEFALLFEGLDSAGAADYVARKVHRVITSPYALPSQLQGAPGEVRIGASVGVAIYPDHAADLEHLVALADSTMYEAKRAGGGVRIQAGGAPTGPVAAAPAPPDPAHLHLVRNRDTRTDN